MQSYYINIQIDINWTCSLSQKVKEKLKFCIILSEISFRSTKTGKKRRTFLLRKQLKMDRKVCNIKAINDFCMFVQLPPILADCVIKRSYNMIYTRRIPVLFRYLVFKSIILSPTRWINVVSTWETGSWKCQTIELDGSRFATTMADGWPFLAMGFETVQICLLCWR